MWQTAVGPASLLAGGQVDAMGQGGHGVFHVACGRARSSSGALAEHPLVPTAIPY